MFFNYEGQQVPQVNVWTLAPGGWYALTTSHLFSDRTIILFAVSGAFTGPHASVQLSEYNKYVEWFKSQGVDEVICISVNDPFVLSAWAQTEKANQVRFIPDAGGNFTRKLGMMVNLSNKGMGQRSWRYSMLVKDQVIEKMFVEPDGFETEPVLCDAKTMLNYFSSETAKLGEKQA